MTTSTEIAPRPGAAQGGQLLFGPAELCLLLEWNPEAGSPPPSTLPNRREYERRVAGVNDAVSEILAQVGITPHAVRPFARTYERGERGPIFLAGDSGFVLQTVNLDGWRGDPGIAHAALAPSVHAVADAYRRIAEEVERRGALRGGNYILYAASPNWLGAPFDNGSNW